MYTTPIAKNRFSRERFPTALKGLMEERHLSYRQLAYKTKLSAGYLNHLTKGTRPVPADPVIAVIAEALAWSPTSSSSSACARSRTCSTTLPSLADKLYGILLRSLPVPEDIGDALAHPQQRQRQRRQRAARRPRWSGSRTVAPRNWGVARPAEGPVAARDGLGRPDWRCVPGRAQSRLSLTER